MVKTLIKPLREEKGSALVELALVLPIVLLILFSIIDFGTAFNYWEDTTQLSAQGARWAAVNTNPGSGTLQAYIRSQANTAEMRQGGGTSVPTPAQVCVSFPNGTSNIGDPVKVSISITYNWMGILKTSTGIASSTLTASQTMRLEAVPSTYTAGCS